MRQPVIHVDAIRKTYGRTVAVDEIHSKWSLVRFSG